MRHIAKFSVVLVVFGQLAFGAASYYFGIPHPSWPFWAVVYVFTAVLAVRRIAHPRFAPPDLYLSAFMGFVVLRFIIDGESDRGEFATLIVTMCIAPYVGGRLLGGYIKLPFSGVVQVIAICYTVMLGVELVRNPGLLDDGRLVLYAPEGERLGGDPTQFFVGITVASAWIMAFASLTLDGRGGVARAAETVRRRWVVIVILLPAVLFIAGSRTSLVAISLAAPVLLICAYWIPTQRRIQILSGVVATFVLVYVFLPGQRRLFIDELGGGLFGMSEFWTYSVYCSQVESSFLNRVVLMSEAWRLFLESPIWGVGAGNYGLRWCGQPTEFASPHALMVQILAEFGLIGAALFFTMLAKIVSMFLRTMRSAGSEVREISWGLFGVWVVALIQEQFIGNLYSSFQFFLLSGVLVAQLAPYRHAALSARTLRLRPQPDKWVYLEPRMSPHVDG